MNKYTRKAIEGFILIFIGLIILLLGFYFLERSHKHPHVIPSNFIPTGQFGVYNNCSSPIWLQSQNQPESDAHLIYLKAHNGYSYHVNGELIDAFRVWPKLGCDKHGENCTTGQEMAPCDKKYGCQPPIDSLIEGTFNDNGNYIDLSAVNGFTLPYKLIIIKSESETSGSCTDGDASYLDVKKCPTNENLSTPLDQMAQFGDDKFGPFLSYNKHDLRHVDLRIINPRTHTLIGCAGPGTQLTDTTWGGIGVGANESAIAATYYNEAIMYACPFTSNQLLTDSGTPDTNLPWPPENKGFNKLSHFCTTTKDYCTADNPNGPAASDICKLGPVINTQYVKYIHKATKSVYAYQYDDVNGLKECNDSSTKFIFTL